MNVPLGPISAPSWKSSALASPTVVVRPISDIHRSSLVTVKQPSAGNWRALASLRPSTVIVYSDARNGPGTTLDQDPSKNGGMNVFRDSLDI
jgi:hypothetical protein